MNHPTTIAAALSICEPFSLLPEDARAALAERFVPRVKAPFGTELFAEGERGGSLLLVRSGRLRVVRKQVGSREVTLRVVGPGEIVGELALLGDGHVRESTARVAQEAELAVLSRKQFAEFLAEWPQLAGGLRNCLQSKALTRFLRGCIRLMRVPELERGKSVEDVEGGNAGLGEFARVFHELRRISVKKGARVRLADWPALYVVQRGEFAALADGRQVGVVREGEGFGHEAVLDIATELTFEARVSGEVLFFPIGALRPLLEGSKHLTDHFRARAKEWRLLATEGALDSGAIPAQTLDTPEPPLTPAEPEATAADFRAQGTIRRFQHVQQQEQADCGAACLGMVLRHYGKRIGLGRLRDLANVSSYGASMASLSDAAEALGLVSRGMLMPYEALIDVRLPAIVHWRGIHYVVLYRVTQTHAWIADPALGIQKISREAFERDWTQRVLLLAPTDAVHEVEESPSPLRRFVGFLRGHKRLVCEALACGIVLQVLALTLPVFTQQVVDRVVVTKSLTLLNILLVAIVVAQLADSLLSAAQTYLLTHASMRMNDAMLGAFFRHLLALPTRFFALRRTGDVLRRFTDSLRIQDLLMNKPLQVTLQTFLLLGYVALMLYYSVSLTLAVLGFGVPFLLVAVLATPRLKAFSRRTQAARGESDALLVEALGAPETVKGLCLERAMRTLWEEKLSRAENAEFKARMVSLGVGTLSNALTGAAWIFVLYLGAKRVIAADMSLGQLLAFSAMTQRVFGPLRGFVSAWDAVQRATVSLERLEEVFDSHTEEDICPSRVRLPKVEGRVRFDRVFFRYGSRDTPWTLKGVSLSVDPGQTVAIVGRSGSGKSTLAKLLLRLHSPDSGAVTVDGQSLNELDPGVLRRRVGTVLQESRLFRGTVGFNIAGGRTPDMRRVVEAARLAGAHEFISALPDGYETELKNMGSSLSGGQRQRLSLARAFYRKPKVLILDEATSALDAETEAQVQRNLDAFLTDRAAIVIAHRVSTVRNADRILVLDDGRVVEEGRHDELTAQRGLYHQLCQEQLQL